MASSDVKLTGTNREKRHAFKYPGNTWADGVNYCFSPEPGKEFRKVFNKAVKAWQQDTYIDFKENATAHDRILIKTNEKGCESNVDRVGRGQLLYLGQGCHTFDNIVHELGHSLGLLPIMNRHDREDFITVNEWNIKSDLLGEYRVLSEAYIDNYGVEYDYGSIMQYKWRRYNELP
ncbi:hypothetical protein Aduo_007951 [Ancylostoma duodenale]